MTRKTKTLPRAAKRPGPPNRSARLQGAFFFACAPSGHARACICLWLAAALLAGCASDAPVTRGQVQGAAFSARELLQSEGNRITQTAMLANRQSLLALAGKLYRRNPSQWRKTAATREAALQKIAAALDSGQPWPPLAGARDIAALSLALSTDFAGDRVAAFIIACADTIIAAHGGRQTFYYLDGVDPQRLHNAARNMETALWVLNSRRDARGAPLLLANEIGPDARNLSFEREFGKIIGRLDLLAQHLTERHRRAVIGYAQGVAAAPFLAFLPVR